VPADPLGVQQQDRVPDGLPDPSVLDGCGTSAARRSPAASKGGVGNGERGTPPTEKQNRTRPARREAGATLVAIRRV